jgi:type III pantothenate kinase
LTGIKKEEFGPISIVVIDVGNTKVAVGRWVEGNVYDVHRVPRGDRAGVIEAIEAVRARCENQVRQAMVIASVVPETTAWLCEHIENELDLRPFVIGDNTPLPVEVAVTEPVAVGVDRVCSAAAAFVRTGHACTVVSVGSAVTVDVIDDDGVFRGGAIFPGLQLQAQALADHTAALPLVEPTVPDSAIGASTQAAIQSGVCFGLVGAIRNIVEHIATEGNKWPQVVVTGGGIPLLQSQLDFVDSLVPDLCLMGIGLAYMKRIEEMTGG